MLSWMEVVIPTRMLMSKISPRESQLLKLLGQAKSNKQIAYELSITEQTVKNELRLTYLKLGVCNRVGAVIKAAREGLITIGQP